MWRAPIRLIGGCARRLRSTRSLCVPGSDGERRRSNRLFARLRAARAGERLVSADLVRPDLETEQRIRPEGVSDRHVGCVAALTDQHAADSRDVVARIKGVPPPAKIGLEPAR